MDEVTELLEELARSGVTLAVDRGQLRLSAGKGVLTVELQRRLVNCKELILRRLDGMDAAASRRCQRIVPQPDADHLPFPLSDLQLGFYVANDPYMELHVRPHCYMEFEARDLDVAAYETAWNRALSRHRRELCAVNRDIELQLLDREAKIELKVYNLRGLQADAVEAHLRRIREEMQRQELPLDSWPWLDLRASLWNEPDGGRVRIHYNHNNYFIDGYGTMQLLAEIDEYYRDPALRLPPLELSYRDAVLGLDGLADSEPGRVAKQYWLSRLQRLPAPPSLPQKPGLSRRCRSHLERREAVLARPSWEAFKSRASALGVTPSNALIAAYAYVIATWSNSDHFIFSQMATRRFADLHPELLKMVGNFVSLYPLEVRLDRATSFVENASGIQRQVLEDLKHLEFGGMRVLQELNRLKGSFGTAPSPFVVGSGLFLKHYRRASFTVLETSQTLLDHQFFELADGSCHYVWDLMEEFFPEGLIDSMWQAYGALLDRLARDPEAWHLTEFDMIPETDLRPRRLRNQTGRPEPDGALHDALAKQAVAQGERAALVSAAGTLSYREMDTWSSALATELTSRGVRKGDLVPVVMDRDHELLVAVMAVLKCGAAYVPLDPRLPLQRLVFLLTDVGARVVLTEHRHFASTAWPERVTPVCVSRPVSPRPAAGAPHHPSSAAYGSDLAYVIYTSGSTGTPKGVMIDHRGALNTVLDVNERFGVGPTDRLFGISAFNFDLSVYDIFGAVAAAACLVYPRPESALDPAHWLDVMHRERVTIWNSVPALMRLLVETAERRQISLPALRLVLLSGDKIPLDLPEAIRRIAPNAQLVSLGGATEASIWSILYPIEDVDPAWPTIPYGFPMVNQSWHVLDRCGRPCPTWVPGELYIGGVGVALGYWHDPDKTARSFGPDPYTGERLYRTGDLGRYLPDGCIEWMGRVDFQVKVQGQRIELGEIEAALAESPAVAQAVVTVQETPGTQHPRLVGYIVPATDQRPEVKDIEAFLQRKLPAHMVPTAWRMLEQLPLSVNGKVDRKALLQMQVDVQAETGANRRHVPPSGPVESTLQAMWERLLDISSVGVTDDFFELGGQSFDAVRMFALIKEEFGCEFSLSDIWRARTIRELAKRIANGEVSEHPGRVVPVDPNGTGTPLFLVHPAGGSVMAYFRLRGLLDRPLYGIQAHPPLDGAGRRQDVVELARQYVADLRGLQPSGPYAVGGWSSGAMIAFEMAAQLEAAGERVTQLFILDGPTPHAHPDLSDERLLRWFLDDLALPLALERLEGEQFTGLPLAEQLRRAAERLGTEQAWGPGIDALVPTYEVFRDVVLAGSRYRPGRISADVTVIRVEENIVEEFSAHPDRHESDWGWREFTRGKVRCVLVPGTHHTFLADPLVKNWCALLCASAPGSEPAPRLAPAAI